MNWALAGDSGALATIRKACNRGLGDRVKNAMSFEMMGSWAPGSAEGATDLKEMDDKTLISFILQNEAMVEQRLAEKGFDVH